MKTQKVVIADPHPITRIGVASLLNSKKYTVVGKISRGSELLQCLQEQRPDLLILELDMPEIHGFHALRSIKKEFPKTRIAIFSSHPEEIYAIKSIKSGAAGYISKNDSAQIFQQAIDRIALGGTFLNEKISATSIEGIDNKNNPINRYKKLSTREIEVLDLISSGKRNKEIAVILGINEKTVSTYKTRLLKKLKVSNIAELINQSRAFQFY